jgi:hypothetical protein
MTEDCKQASTHNEALELAMQFARQRHREGRSRQWLFERIESIQRPSGDTFFSDGEIWEMIDNF